MAKESWRADAGDGVGGDGGGEVLVAQEEFADAGDEGIGESRLEHFAVERFFGGAVAENFFGSEGVTEEIANDFVVAFAVHATLHGLGGFDAVAAVVFGPGEAVEGVGVDEDAIHVEEEGADFSHGSHR